MPNDLSLLTSSLAERYAIERELGRGGMATVYLAQDLKHGRRVAIKVLHAELAHAIGPKRFLREIEIVARLNHPHILPLHDSGATNGALYYVMPYVDGESLDLRLSREKQLPVDEAIRIGREVADALAYAHAHGVIHRDVKPGNILLEANHAVITDFGVALLPHDAAGQRLTHTGMTLGTPQYMSPEQATGQQTIDERSDIYSLGCVLYEMLSGDPPFTGSNPRALLAKKLVEPAPRLRVVRSTVSQAVENAVLTALATTPADRFRTAAEFAEALEVARHEPALADSPRSRPAGSPPGTSRAPAQARLDRVSLRAWLGIAATITGMLTAIGFVTTLLYDVVMQIPSEYTPTETNFPLIGVRALIPSLVYALVVLVAYVILHYTCRLLVSGLRRFPPARETLDALTRRSMTFWHRVGRTANPSTVAELFLIGAVLVSAIAIAPFWYMLSADGPNSQGAGVLSLFRQYLGACAYLTAHRSWALAMTVLITVLAIGWLAVLRYVRARRASGAGTGLPVWGGLAWILMLVLLMTAPWRLRWDNDRPRVRLNDERAYVLFQRGSDLVVYNAARGAAHAIRADDAGLERLNSTGYVFEELRAFEAQWSIDAPCGPEPQ